MAESRGTSLSDLATTLRVGFERAGDANLKAPHPKDERVRAAVMRASRSALLPQAVLSPLDPDEGADFPRSDDDRRLLRALRDGARGSRRALLAARTFEPPWAVLNAEEPQPDGRRHVRVEIRGRPAQLYSDYGVFDDAALHETLFLSVREVRLSGVRQQVIGRTLEPARPCDDERTGASICGYRLGLSFDTSEELSGATLELELDAAIVGAQRAATALGLGSRPGPPAEWGCASDPVLLVIRLPSNAADTPVRGKWAATRGEP